jgi:beta-barrel assembly-enhancing protease
MDNMTTYKAIAYADDFTDGRISGTLNIDGDYLVFNGHETTWRIHRDDVVLDHGGTSGRQIFFASKKDRYRLSSADLDILKQPFFASHHTNNEKTASIIKQRTTAKLAVTGALIVLCLGLGSLIYFRSSIAHLIADKVPYTMEQSLGDTYIQQLATTESLDTTSAVVLGLRQKMQLLTKHIDHHYNFKIYVSPSEDVNAFALPGGHVVFNKGLLNEADSWEEVLGVGGHELAHVTEKHHTRGVISKVGVFTLLSLMFGDGSALTDIIFGAGAQLEGLSYSRAYETESDIKGFEYLTTAGINPAGLRTFFDKLNHLHGDGDQALNKLDFLSTHPSPDNRIEKLQTLEKNKGARKYQVLGDYRLFKQLLNPACSLDEL